MKSLFSRMFSRPATKNARPIARGTMLRVESLDQRLVPSTVPMTPIQKEYQSIGGSQSVLGLPTSGEHAAGLGSLAQSFQGGAIYYTPTTGAHENHGVFRTEYIKENCEFGPLGLPTSDEQAAGRGGRAQAFQGGAIYTSAATGTHGNLGVIRAEYIKVDCENGFLGLPTSDEQMAGHGGRAQAFQGGNIYTSAVTGTHEIHGGIFNAFSKSGYEYGPLGLPTSDEYAYNGGRRSDFQGGSIIFDGSVARVLFNVSTEHPGTKASLPYINVTGTLFAAGGPSYLDVHQGVVGDCWVLSSLAAVAARSPATIQNMFVYSGKGMENGTPVDLYVVHIFGRDNVWHNVTVDTELPAGGTYYDHVGNGVLWVALAEKAYAEANHAGIVSSQHIGVGTYEALDGGDPQWALHAFTGKSAGSFSVNPANVAAAWNSGQFVVLTSSNHPASQNIVGDASGLHSYALVGYNASNSNHFSVYNPWGTDANGWALGTFNGRKVWGLFTCDAGFLSQNFGAQSLTRTSSFDVRGNAGIVNIVMPQSAIVVESHDTVAHDATSAAFAPRRSATLEGFRTDRNDFDLVEKAIAMWNEGRI